MSKGFLTDDACCFRKPDLTEYLVIRKCFCCDFGDGIGNGELCSPAAARIEDQLGLSFAVYDAVPGFQIRICEGHGKKREFCTVGECACSDLGDLFRDAEIRELRASVKRVCADDVQRGWKLNGI